MVVSANGKPIDVPEGCTVHRLIEMLGLGSRWVVVERNGQPVARSDFDTVRLEPGDALEVVRPVQGG
ncbi:MAG TPA: sulfur carrier protein ThiS [Actinomycetota bacterium]|nr:sulfur carrier protein ThiS [Actinomycetota bacterium]